MDDENKKTYKLYISGFLLCLVLSVCAFLVVNNNLLLGSKAIWAIFILAFIQLFVQLKFFLRLGHEPKPKINLTTFILTMLGVAIVVVGSLWIMAHLNYNMTPSDVNSYILQSEGFGQ